MIIWINGTYGVGKTTVANKLIEKLENKGFELLNSDEYYHNMIKENNSYAFGGTLPQNNINFIKYFRKTIVERIKNNKKLIVDMAVTENCCKEELYDYLKNQNINILHFILISNEEKLKENIKKDINRDYNLAINFFKINSEFLNKNFSNSNSIIINTNEKDVNEIVQQILKEFNK